MLPRAISLLSAGVGALLLVAQPGSAQNLSVQDRTFMENASKGGMMEVHMGHLGLERGSSDGVKSFAKRLIDDHTKGNQELQGLAKQKGVMLPADNPGMPAALTTKTGKDFDQAFAKMGVEDHEKDIKEFEKEASSGSDPDIKSWASKTLPTLKSHLDAARALPR
jgi:putative membrane protein